MNPSTSSGQAGPVLILIEYIDHNPYQVRQGEDPTVVAELAANIEKNTLLQPPTIRKIALEPHDQLHQYQIAFGHTRLAAYKLLAGQGKEEYRQIPCFVKELDDLQMFEMAVAENIKRRDLNPIERARAMQTYMEKFNKTSTETGEFFACDEATVRGTVRLLGLPEVAQAKLSGGEITMGAARQLLILVRMAPDSVEASVQKIIEGELPDKVVEGVLDGLAFKNKAIKMWAGWRSGKPSGGPDLWELDARFDKLVKYLPLIAGLEGLDMRLVKKALENEDWTAHNRHQLEDWVRKLQSGLVAPEALIAQGAPAEMIERLDQLVHPPACTACPFYVKAQNNHYCTWKICHTRKKEAWSFSVLEKKEKELNIRALSRDESRAGFVVLDSSWNDAQKALFEAKDPNLRLHVKPGQFDHSFTKSAIVELVTIAPKAVEEKKAEKEQAGQSGQKEREERYKRQQKLSTASQEFEETEARPVFMHLLDPLDNLAFLMTLANMTDLDFEPDDGEKAPSKKEKLRLCRMEIIGSVFDNVTDYETDQKGPVAAAELFQSVAKNWGVELPADWLEKAATYWPKDVEPSVSAEEDDDE